MSYKKQIEKYIELLRKGKENESLAFKKEILPKSIFKYRTLNEYALNCLEHESVWLSQVYIQNDPFDCSLSFSDKIFLLQFLSIPDFKKYFKEHYGKDISEFEIKKIMKSPNPENAFQKICAQKRVKMSDYLLNEYGKLYAESYLFDLKKDIAISCFSERNDSILMWSHYSNKHQGICIEYDFRTESEILNTIEPIYYSDKVVSLLQIFESRNYADIIKIAAITKAKDWQYEKEWRIIVQEKGFGYYNVPLPKAIYLGAKFFDKHANDDALYERLIRYCSSKQIPLKRMKLHETKYKVVDSNA